jgi:hypothetical protein
MRNAELTKIVEHGYRIAKTEIGIELQPVRGQRYVSIHDQAP